MRRLDGGLSRRFERIRDGSCCPRPRVSNAPSTSPRTSGRPCPSAVRDGPRGRGGGARERLLDGVPDGAACSPPDAASRSSAARTPASRRSSTRSRAQRAAIVTDVPGTTRDTLEATVDDRRGPRHVVDTAGLRATEDAVERIGVARAREAAERADLVLYVSTRRRRGLGDAGEALERSRDGRPVLARSPTRSTARTPESVAAVAETALALCGLAPDAGERLRAPLAARSRPASRPSPTSEVLASLRQRDLAVRARSGRRPRALESLRARRVAGVRRRARSRSRSTRSPISSARRRRRTFSRGSFPSSASGSSQFSSQFRIGTDAATETFPYGLRRPRHRRRPRRHRGGARGRARWAAARRS